MEGFNRVLDARSHRENSIPRSTTGATVWLFEAGETSSIEFPAESRIAYPICADPCVAIGTTAAIKGFQGGWGVAIIPPSRMKIGESNANHEDEN